MIDQCTDDTAPGSQGHERWTRQQAAKVLRINVRTLDKWCKKLGLRYVKIENKIFLDPRDVEKFFASRVKSADELTDCKNGNGHSGQNGNDANNNGHNHAGSNGKLDGSVSGDSSHTSLSS